MEEKKKSTKRPERQIYQPPKSVNHLPGKPQNSDRSRLSWNSRENFHKPVGSSFQYNNYGDRRPNRKPNREEHKQYANTKDIPPRFQKKFMEAYQNKPHFVQDHNQHVIRDHHHYYQQTNELINRTGQHQQHPQHQQQHPQHQQHQQHQPQQSYQQHHHQQHQQHPQHQQHQSHVDPRSQPRRASNELPETRNDQENRGPEPQGSYSRIEPMVNHYHQGNEQKHQSWANAPIIEHTSVPHHATSNFQRVNEPLTVNKPCGVIRPTAHAYQTNNNQKLTHYPQSSNMTLQIPINYTNHGLPIEYLSSFQNCNQLIEGDKPIMAMPPPFFLQYLQNLSSQSHLANQRVGIPPPSHLTGSSFDSLNQTIVQKCISEIKQLELDLREALQKRSESGEKNPVITALLARIQALYQQVILDNPQYCKEHDVELALWNTVFYQFIKSHLQEIEKNPDSQSIKDELLSEIEVASVFFETLLAKLEAAFKFTVDEYIDRHYEEKCDDIMGATLSAQKIVLYLGDLAHYRGQALNSPNYNKAQSYYLKAHQIAPRMGMPFHRLALLAVHGRRRLEAVYNYMRSLAARVPEESSRKGLLTIFEEVKTKFEAAENERLSKSLQSLKVSEESRDLRKGGQSSEKPNNIPSDSDNKSGEEELNSLRDEELTRRFVLSFLHVHGKLFTKTGLESFDSTVHQMFMELRCLLKRSPFPMSSQRLLQMMAINMFSAYPGQQQFIQEKAIQITLTMAALLLERVDASLEKHDSVESSSVVADDVAELLPTLKIWTDWMITCYCVNDDPSFIVPQFPIGGVSDVFSLLADVLTRLEKIDLIDLKTTDFESNKRLEGYDRITLDEDTLLSGFLPLCVAPNACSYALSPGDKEKARTSLRITRIKLFGQYLCGKVKPYLVYDVGNGRFWSCVPAKTTHKVNFNQQTRANVENGAHA